MNELVKYMNDTLNKYIRPLTFPMAVRFFKEGEELPPRAKVPTRDFGGPIAICQGIALVRRYGWTLAFYQNDMACPVSQVMLGYVEEPDFIKDGCLCKPLYNGNDEAAARTQASTPKLPAADTHCIVICPLDKCDFDPDVVLCYGSGAQIIRMVQGALYKEGGYIESRFAGRGACGGEIAVPYMSGRCNVIICGGGERVFGLTGDDEVAFAIPACKIKDTADGIIAVHKGGVARIPTPFAGLTTTPAFPKYYDGLAEYCGLK